MTTNDSDPVAALTLILSRSGQIASSLRTAATETTGPSRKYASDLATFFAALPSAEQVMMRADAMAVCAPLMKVPDQDTPSPPTTWRIGDAVDQGIAYALARRSLGGRLVMLIGYPMLVLVLATVLLFMYLMFLVPVFDQMFREFGLQLPANTSRIFGVSRLLNAYWPWVLGLPILLLCVFGLIAQAQQRESRVVWSTWLGRLFCFQSDALSQLASHVALLLKSGFPTQDAIRFAGNASEKGWVRRDAQHWVRQMQSGEVPVANEETLHGSPCRLFAFGMRLASGEAAESALAVEVLEESAIVYRERARTQQSTFLAILSPAVSILTVSVVSVLLIALFQPLLQLIRGLT